MRGIASVLGNTSDIGERMRKLQADEKGRVAEIAAELETCATRWTIRDRDSGRYWQTRCVLSPGHDSRCVDHRLRWGPA